MREEKPLNENGLRAGSHDPQRSCRKMVVRSLVVFNTNPARQRMKRVLPSSPKSVIVKFFLQENGMDRQNENSFLIRPTQRWPLSTFPRGTFCHGTPQSNSQARAHLDSFPRGTLANRTFFNGFVLAL
jgi:hypothetical protein